MILCLVTDGFYGSENEKNHRFWLKFQNRDQSKLSTVSLQHPDLYQYNLYIRLTFAWNFRKIKFSCRRWLSFTLRPKDVRFSGDNDFHYYFKMHNNHHHHVNMVATAIECMNVTKPCHLHFVHSYLLLCHFHSFPFGSYVCVCVGVYVSCCFARKCQRHQNKMYLPVSCSRPIVDRYTFGLLLLTIKAEQCFSTG